MLLFQVKVFKSYLSLSLSFSELFDTNPRTGFYNINIKISSNNNIKTYSSALQSNSNGFNNKNENEMCNECELKVDSAFHLIYECTKYEAARNEMIATIEARGGQWPCSENLLIIAEYFNIFNKFCEKI
jgi:hypothetical protein